jgi:hypothetical protein
MESDSEVPRRPPRVGQGARSLSDRSAHGVRAGSGRSRQSLSMLKRWQTNRLAWTVLGWPPGAGWQLHQAPVSITATRYLPSARSAEPGLWGESRVGGRYGPEGSVHTRVGHHRGGGVRDIFVATALFSRTSDSDPGSYDNNNPRRWHGLQLEVLVFLTAHRLAWARCSSQVGKVWLGRGPLIPPISLQRTG